MSQKLFNKVVGILVLIKAIMVTYYWLTDIRVVTLFGPVAGWIEILVVILCLGIVYIAFTMNEKQKYITQKTQKLFDQFLGVLSGLDALTGAYYLLFSVHILLGNWVFPNWLMVIIMAVDIYMFYAAFSLANKIK